MFWFFIGLAILYVLIQLLYWYHWEKLHHIDPDPDYFPQTFVSIVIPARNEATRILDCIHSVMQQNYPSDLFEIIVVDDYSDDGIDELLKEVKDQSLQFISLSKGNLPGGKKNALTEGIAHAKGDWIVTLDADCEMQKDCLSTSVYAYEKSNARIATGAVLISEAKGEFQRFQSYEIAGLMLITGSGFQSGLHYLANGAFLSFSKEAFHGVEGYASNSSYASGDDMFLMEAIAQNYPDQIFFLKNKNAFVTTQAEVGWKAFLSQRLRWASKNKGLTNQKITLIWGFIWLYALVVLCAFGLSFVQPKVFLPGFIVLILSKVIADWLLISSAAKFFKMPLSILSFIISEVFQIGYVILIGFYQMTGIKKFNWKGRKTQ